MQIVRNPDGDQRMAERLDGMLDVVFGLPQHPFLAAKVCKIAVRQQSLIRQQNDASAFSLTS